MKVSIIIPTYNEQQYIGRLLDRIMTADNDQFEVIVVDGGSTDETAEIVKGYNVRFESADLNRSLQMNHGASLAQYETLYFIHADTLPPTSFLTDIKQSFEEGMEACCYRSKFENGKGMLRINAYVTRFSKLFCRGGDQSLAISASLFNELGCFDEKMSIMEEYPLIKKLMDRGKFKVIPKAILISTRKYIDNSWVKVSLANLKAYRMFKKGEDSDEIKRVYQGRLGIK